MRIWDLPVNSLCRKHLLAEHRELHAIWAVITQKRKGYSFHPETLRWKGKLKALYLRHEAEIKEFGKRGYQHRSQLDKRLASGKSRQDFFVNTVSEQKKNLKRKGCECKYE